MAIEQNYVMYSDYDWFNNIVAAASTAVLSEAAWQASIKGMADIMCELCGLVYFDDWTFQTPRGKAYYLGFEGDEYPKFMIRWSAQVTRPSEINMIWYTLVDKGSLVEDNASTYYVNGVDFGGDINNNLRFCMPLMYIRFGDVNTFYQGFRYVKDGNNIFMFRIRYASVKGTVITAMYDVNSHFSFGIIDSDVDGIVRRMPINSKNNYQASDSVYTYWWPYIDETGTIFYGTTRKNLACWWVTGNNVENFSFMFNMFKNHVIEMNPNGWNVSRSCRLYFIYTNMNSICHPCNTLTINGKKYLLLMVNGDRFAIGYEIKEDN